jgi:methionyl-tRNA formyltransferase
MNRERETGITLHEIDYTLDTGPIIETVKTPITERDTAEALCARCMDLLYGLFTEYFPRLVVGDYVTRPNPGGRLYLKKDLEDAKDISHVARAFTFPGKESAYWYDRHGTKHYVRW